MCELVLTYSIKIALRYLKQMLEVHEKCIYWMESWLLNLQFTIQSTRAERGLTVFLFQILFERKKNPVCLKWSLLQIFIPHRWKRKKKQFIFNLFLWVYPVNRYKLYKLRVFVIVVIFKYIKPFWIFVGRLCRKNSIVS